MLPNVYDCHMMATYHPKSSRVNRSHIYASDMIKKASSKIQKKLQKETSKIFFLRLLIRIRSENRPKGVKLRFEYDHIAPSGFGVADQEGTDSYVLFGSNTTYVWTGSPQVIILFTARFKYDHKPDPPPSDHVMFVTEITRLPLEEKKDRGPALFIIIYTWL